MYDVFLDELELYGVTEVQETSDRNISVYNGLGQGNFPIADDRELKSWAIKCQLSENNDFSYHNWTSAKELFDAFDELLGSRAESRLVITSQYTKTSELVLLERYTKTEIANGVFDVTVECTEYVNASVRTTTVPYIPRPGKVPVQPVIVLSEENGDTPYSRAPVAPYSSSDAYSGSESRGYDYVVPSIWYNPRTGEDFTNPNLIPYDEPVYTQFSGTLGVYEPIGNREWDRENATNLLNRVEEFIRNERQQEAQKAMAENTEKGRQNTIGIYEPYY